MTMSGPTWGCVAAALAALALSGCGVRSDAPLFTARDAALAKVRDGVWALSGAGCELGSAASEAALPSCALAVRIKGVVLTPLGRMAKGDDATPLTLLLVEGRPLIVQAAEDSGHTMYYGARVLDRDVQGRAVRVLGWVLACPSGAWLDDCKVDDRAAVRAQAGAVAPLQSAYLAWIAP